MMRAPDGTLRRYDRVAAALHWVIAALLAGQFAVGHIFHMMDRGPVRTEWFTWHKTLGLAILLLAIVRLGWRLRHPPRPLPPAIPRWRRRLAAGVHGAFHGLLIALPVSGLVAVSAYTGTSVIPLAGGLALPQLPGMSVVVGEAAEQHHKLLVQITVLLTVVHVAAALWHRVRRA